MIRHTHDPHAEPCIWHDGSLASCPDSTWTDITYEGKPARFYHGYSVSLPPDTAMRFRYINETEIV